ncbi:MAG: type IX secretion system outer membrane channel protein PorV [Lentimicrobiaceae bacterium]|nr:type IX secretion system outer membrane channel protein PorV [Lentimicrobiaceae bacterium]
MTKEKIIIVLVCIIATMNSVRSQNQTGVLGQDKRRNVITTGVPSMLIGPDSRMGAMGEAGVAVDDDINAQHWNPSKYVFMENAFGIGLSYSPWLAGLGVNDIHILYLSGYAKAGKMGAVSFALRYFSMGEMELTDYTGTVIKKSSPHEFAIDAAYSRKLIDNLSMAVSFRFIYSYLSNYSAYGNQDAIKPGMSGAADVSLFYNKELRADRMESSKIAWGLCISNMGAKISYSKDTEYRSFIPANFRTGIAYTIGMDKYNKITFAFDLNKLLVPTPPLWLTDSSGAIIRKPNGRDAEINRGRDPNSTSPAGALITSWFDAPGYSDSRGSKFAEEMDEFIQNIGIEYAYSDLFFIRTGFFNEAKAKGNRKYITFGVGLKYSMFGIDASYILPVSSRNHPLENTVRFSLTFDFSNKSTRR